MNAYFKLRNENPHFLEKSTAHGKIAMLYGHNTGYVQERLVINLDKLKKINQAIQICDIVLLDNFHFSTHGCGSKNDFTKRKYKLLQKLEKTTDNQSNKLFTDEEILFLIEQVRLEDKRIETEEIEYEQRMKQFEKEISKMF